MRKAATCSSFRDGQGLALPSRDMTQIRQMHPAIRAPRIGLRGTVNVTLQLENRRQLIAKLHQLSITGGLLELTPYLDERSKVLMAFQLGAGLMQTRADLLFPMRGGMGYMQPFRFTGFAAGCRQTLEAQISALLKQTIGPKHALGVRAPSFFTDSF